MPLSPMMQQYYEIKNQYGDYILFYRLGDFYEMFFEDAKTVSSELGLTLTGRDCGLEERAPMCGVPFHSADEYIGKLIERGFRVAICEQVEDPRAAKGLVRREVVRIITPGTLTESSMLDDTQNNYVCALMFDGQGVGLSFADISTGYFTATDLTGNDVLQKLNNEIGTYAPREVLINCSREKLGKSFEFISERLGAMICDSKETLFEPEAARSTVLEQFGAESAEQCEKFPRCMMASGALLQYIKDTQKTDISYIDRLNLYSSRQFLQIDVNTRRNLELCETMRSKEKKGTLLWVLDHTGSAAGARLLRKWVEAPLVNVHDIVCRQNAVRELYENFRARQELIALEKQVIDLERVMARIIYNTAGPKDLAAICSTAALLPKFQSVLAELSSDEISGLSRKFDLLSDICNALTDALVQNPPFSSREGGFIRDGYNEEIDYLRSVMNDSKAWITRIEKSEREQTGIKNLRIGYNKVFGYYIEVTKSNISDVPERYIRKQTLANCERYITDELKDMEATLLGAKDKLGALEYELCEKMRIFLAEQVHRIQNVAKILAYLDVYASLAEVAVKNKYVCPHVDNGCVISITEGRHPVVEQYIKSSYFVPNDTYLDMASDRVMLITGPNMAGKSTYMRQVALITVMAQIGSFVPAKEASIGVVDQIFTRVGASDDLALGQSTFMLEMSEVAYILKHASARSLIIYDEIGRGTSTFDGMSIARAVLEYTANKIGAKTMFATHYHELTSAEQDINGVVNYNIAAKKRNDDIIFLRKIIKGVADDSYGIEVAKLAGVPQEVIARAKKVLSELENHTESSVHLEGPRKKALDSGFLEIPFAISEEHPVLRRLRELNADTLTPLEALSLLYELKKEAD